MSRYKKLLLNTMIAAIVLPCELKALDLDGEYRVTEEGELVMNYPRFHVRSGGRLINNGRLTIRSTDDNFIKITAGG
ncbi:MAG: hypothetical protein LBE97_01000, partial [Holosporales bacterium]|nr:hypothetical protein [Holosporales bacterium]